MLETPHVVVGAAITYLVPNPLISLPLAFLSHFVLDRIPHWNPHLNTEIRQDGKISSKSTKIVIVDSVSALILGSSIAFSTYPDITRVIIILLGSFLSVLPDVVEAPYFFLHIKIKWLEKWMKFQKHIQVDAEPLLGLTTQVITVIAALYWIFKS